MDNSDSAAVVALKELYDQYGTCGGRLFELIRRIQGERDD